MDLREKTSMVVFHHALADKCGVDEIREWHKQRGFDDIGYHYVIRKNGKIEVGRSLFYKGAHDKEKNAESIGVCLEGDFRKYQPTIHQLEASYRLYDCLCQCFCKELEVRFHRPTNDQNPCPGRQLNRYRFLTLLRRNKLHE